MIDIILSLIAALASLRAYSLYYLSAPAMVHFQYAFATNSLVTVPGVTVIISLGVSIVLTILVVAAIWVTFKKTSMKSDPYTVLKLSQCNALMSSKVLMEDNVIEARGTESRIDDVHAVLEGSVHNNKKPPPSRNSNMQPFDNKELNAAAEQGNNDASQENDTKPAVKVLLHEEAKQQAEAAVSEIQAGDVIITAVADSHAMEVDFQQMTPEETESTKIVATSHTNSEDSNTSCAKSPAASTHGNTASLTSVAGNGGVKSENDNEEQQSRLLKKSGKRKLINARPRSPSLQPSKSRDIRNRVQAALNRVKPSKSCSSSTPAKKSTRKPSVHRRYFSFTSSRLQPSMSRESHEILNRVQSALRKIKSPMSRSSSSAKKSTGRPPICRRFFSLSRRQKATTKEEPSSNKHRRSNLFQK